MKRPKDGHKFDLAVKVIGRLFSGMFVLMHAAFDLSSGPHKQMSGSHSLPCLKQGQLFMAAAYKVI